MPETETLTDGSLRSRLVARREELRDQKPFDLDVPGYKGVLRARYRALDYTTIRKIGLRQSENPDQADRELKIAIDSLVNSCVCLLEVTDGVASETRFKWDEQTARELFGIDEEELPEGSTARNSVLRMIPNTAAVMQHYFEYDSKVRGVEESVAETVEGESEAVLVAA